MIENIFRFLNAFNFETCPLREIFSQFTLLVKNFYGQKDLPDGELNPGLPRDRRGYSPLYYRGLHDIFALTTGLIFVIEKTLESTNQS